MEGEIVLLPNSHIISISGIRCQTETPRKQMGVFWLNGLWCFRQGQQSSIRNYYRPCACFITVKKWF